MENSPNSIEMQIDNFLEHFKRSASKAMDSEWTSTAGSNLLKSRSRSSCLDVSEMSEVDSSRAVSLTRKEIFDLIKPSINEQNTVAKSIIEKFVSEKLDYPYILSEDVDKKIKKVLANIRKKWSESHRNVEHFYKKNSDWLSQSLLITDNISEENTDVDKKVSVLGRPSTSFAAGSDRTKRRKTENIRQNFGTNQLAYATKMSLRAEGKLDAAKVVSDVTEGTPSKASSYRSSIHQVRERTLTSEEALAIFVESNLSKHQYEIIRSGCKLANSKAYPSYKVISNAKEQCYPPEVFVIVTEKRAEVKLQALLNHTVERIILAQFDDFKKLHSDNLENLILHCKWGCDGTSGQSTFKQIFTDDDNGTTDDENIFFTSLVPLQIFYKDKNNEKIIVWQNPRPSSPRFCRPIKIEFLKETTETTKAEIAYVREQQEKLFPCSVFKEGISFTVKFELSLTMIDGKVCNSVTDNSSTQRCYICKATSKDFNDLDKMFKREIITENLKFGISSLHAWIRCFEWLLRLSYKLDVQKWQARDAKSKDIIKNRRLKTQEAFRKKLGLIVDKPKPGFGSSNDGNTARRFFANASISSQITGVDQNLIERFHAILQVISCGHDIDINKFKEYTLETAKMYVQLYPWYYMPTTVHKILIHGPHIISSALLPIGMMSEEAQEACNKFIKKFRLDFTRKISRTATMTDLMNRMLLNSDPYISSVRKLPGKNKAELTDDAIELLARGQLPVDQIDNVQVDVDSD